MTKLMKPRLGLLLMLVVTVAVGLNAFLTRAKFEDSFAAVEESRHGFVLEAVRGAIQNGLDLGLPLEALPNVQDLMKADIAAAEGVLAIMVDDAKGAELFRAGVKICPPDSGVLRLPLTDSLGRGVGRVALCFSQADRAGFVASADRVTMIATVGAAGIGVVAILIFGSVVLGGAHRRLARMTDAVSGTASGDHAIAPARAVLDDVQRALDALNGTPGTGAPRS